MVSSFDPSLTAVMKEWLKAAPASRGPTLPQVSHIALKPEATPRAAECVLPKLLASVFRGPADADADLLILLSAPSALNVAAAKP